MCGHCWDYEGRYLHGPKAPVTLKHFEHHNGFLTIDQIRVDTYGETEGYCFAVSCIVYPVTANN